MGLPTITAIGHVKFKEYKADKGLCTFLLSCSEKKYKADGYDNFDIPVTVFKGAADFVNNHIHDGDVVEVTGKIETTIWEKNDGSKVKQVKFKFPEVKFVPKPFSNTQNSRNTGHKSPVIHETIKRPEPLEAEELPF